MTIEQHGFLSPEIAQWVARHRVENADAFALAHDLNSAVQGLMLSTKVEMSSAVLDARGLALLLLVRVMSNFQGTILMAERGMIVEARTLARTCLESTFALAAGTNDQGPFVEKMVSHAMDHRTKAARWMLGREDFADFLKEDGQTKLREFVARVDSEGEPRAVFDAYDMARRGGLGALYIFYRALSGDSAHPTIDALNRYVDDGEGSLGSMVKWGPSCGAGEITETLMMASSFVLAAALTILEVSENAEARAALEVLGDTYTELCRRFGPADEVN